MNLHAVYRSVQNGDPSAFDLESFLSTGIAPLEEPSMWDVKRAFPDKSSAGSEEYNYSIESIMKDVVAFHNAYGGFLVSGVDDKSRHPAGDTAILDVDDLRKRLRATTGAEIELRYTKKAHAIGGIEHQFGVLLIPQRLGQMPLTFKSDARQRTVGAHQRCAYKRGIYVRRGSECRPVENNSEDWMFLIGNERFSTYGADTSLETKLHNNLRERDAQLVRFIGREIERSELWRWLSDPFALMKVVAGFGGLGKTTLVRQFCEEVTANPPRGFYKLVWLTAKQSIFDIKNLKKRPASLPNEVPHFSDMLSLLQVLLGEISTDETVIESDNFEDYIDPLIHQLSTLPCIIVIDDADTLVEQQHEVFQTLSLVVNRASSSGQKSRVIITTRQTLGATGGQLLSIRGLSPDALSKFVETILDVEYGLDAKKRLGKKEFEHLQRHSQGSPLFCASILRLMRIESCDLYQAIKLWNVADGDGEAARYFVFGRELGKLSERLKRILYATALLGRTSQIELQQVTGLPPRSIRDDIIALREYHLLADDQSELAGGPDIALPAGLIALKDVMRGAIPNPTAIEKACKDARNAKVARGSAAVANYVNRVAAFWKQGDYAPALELAKYADKQTAGVEADIKCLLGSCYLKVQEPMRDLREADRAFEAADKLGCKKLELHRDWISTRRDLNDWDGVLSVISRADKRFSGGELEIARAEAMLGKAENQISAGGWAIALGSLRQGAEGVQEAFRQRKVEGKVEQLKDIRFVLYDRAFQVATILFPSAAEGLELWILAAEAAKNYAPREYMISRAAEALLGWGETLLSRSKFERSTLDALRRSIDELSNIMIHQAYIFARDKAVGGRLATIKSRLVEIAVKYEKSSQL